MDLQRSVFSHVRSCLNMCNRVLLIMVCNAAQCATQNIKLGAHGSHFDLRQNPALPRSEKKRTHLCHCLYLCLSLSFSLYLYMSPSLCLSLSLPLYLCFSLFLSFFLCLSLFSVYLSTYLSIYMYTYYMSACVYLVFCISTFHILSMCVNFKK